MLWEKGIPLRLTFPMPLDDLRVVLEHADMDADDFIARLDHP